MGRTAHGGWRYASWLLAMFLASCGGGGGGGSAPPPPPSGLSYPQPPTLRVGTAIAALDPKVTGTVSSYSVSPALPAGLLLSTSTGVISGTPTAVAAQATYTVTASNSGGSTTAGVSITVAAPLASTPVITTQPVKTSVPVYRSATLTVAATGNGTLSYQWYIAGLAGSSAPVAGGTAATLTLFPVTAADVHDYYCVVTDTLGSSTATATSFTVPLTVLTKRATITVSGESAVLPASTGHVVSTPAQAGMTYSWTISNGTITAGQGTNQVTYTAGSIGHTAVTVQVLTPTGAGVATQYVAVVASLPLVSVFAQASVLPGSGGILASGPSFPGDTYSWTLTSGTATATITSGQTTDVLTYSVGATTGTYQAGLTLTDQSGNQGNDSETVNVVSNTFVADPRDPGPRSLHTATLLHDGRVLIAGGDAGSPAYAASGLVLPMAGPQSLIVAATELFDPASGTFAAVGPMATARFEHTATLLNDGRVLVVGGANNGVAALASTEIYDPVARSWTAGPSLTTARNLHTATLLSDGRVLVAGGQNSSGAVGTAEVYDPVVNAWSAAGSMVTARAVHSATLMPNGQVLVVGGRGASGNLSTVEIYDPTTNTWMATTPGAGGIGDATVLLLSGQVLAVAANLLYDPATATWIPVGPVDPSGPTGPGGVSGASAVLLPDGRVFASGSLFIPTLGGIYDPIAQAWGGLGAPYPSPALHVFSSATVLADGRVLAVGGVDGSGAGQQQYDPAGATAQVIDPVAGTATTVSSNAHPGALAASAVLPSGSVLVSGGFIQSDAPYQADVTNAADLYTPTTNVWSPAAMLATARGAHTATTLADGSVLAVGGYNDQGTVFSSAERYNAATNTWASASAMANPRYQHTASLLGNGMVLVAGGSNAFVGSCSCTTFLAAAEVYNPATNTWSTTAPLNTARYGHTATVLSSGKVLVTGGFGGVPNTLKNVGAALPTTEIYDPGTGLWTLATPMNNARSYHTATLLPSGLVLVSGGSDASGNTLQTAEVYDPVANTWTSVGSLATPRQSQLAVLLASGNVLVVGGYNTTASAFFGVGSAELYNPGTHTFSPAGSMNTLRQGFTLTVLRNGRVMLVGGLPYETGLPEFYQ